MSEDKTAIEKLHIDAFGFLGARPGSGRVWLNSIEVVDKIIRAFTTDMLANISSKKPLLPWLEFEAMRMNYLFLALSPSDVFDTGPWNSPDQLGEYALIELRIDGVTRLAVRDAFFWYAGQVLNLTKTEFDEVAMNQLIERLRNVLLGLKI